MLIFKQLFTFLKRAAPLIEHQSLLGGLIESIHNLQKEYLLQLD